LISGGKLHLVSKSTKEDVEKLLNYIVSNQLDIVNTVPSLMDLLLDYVNNYKGLHFKYIILAGELFSVELHSKLRDSISVDKLINIYGPTEATINTTLYECKPEDTTIPIGKPLMNYKVLILDKGFYLVPVGVPGEISISGKGMSRGYLNQPELTREKFITSPFFKAERVYRTGDLARWLQDGNIQFLGRIDQQVKIRGNRIELGEIENQLLKHNKIRKVVVIAKELKKENKDLCAYYVTVSENPRFEEKIDHSMQQDIPGDNIDLNISDLKEFLKKRLPDNMIPSYFMQLEEIPLTNSGKVDVKALPEIGRFQMKLEKAYIPPGTDMEKTIADTWKDVLKLDEMGIHDNFFDVGGNSLDIIKVNAQLKKMTNKNISIVSMFRYSTIYSLAQYLEQPEKNDFSLEQDRYEALKRGERDRNVRFQMRKKLHEG
jgi:acyl-coenzyme A synthetase/AMP-(fatty) acid ligase/acyl carrier protein